MKKIYLGFLALSIISILSAFSISNKKSTELCGCVGVDKKSISQNNKTVEHWNETVCGKKCAYCSGGYEDKYNAKYDLERKYEKMYSGTDFKVTVYWVSESFCE